MDSKHWPNKINLERTKLQNSNKLIFHGCIDKDPNQDIKVTKRTSKPSEKLPKPNRKKVSNIK